MKRILALVFVCVAGSCAAAGSAVDAAATLPAAKATAAKLQAQRAAQIAAKKRAQLLQLAPADEYFGPLKLSIIGINNSMRDLGLRYDYNHDLSDRTYASAQLTERAVRDWASRYPHDDQLPRSIFLLQRLYTKILSNTSRDHAHVVAVWLFSSFASSPQARQLRKTLAVEHLAPIASPSPGPDPSTSTSTAPSELVAPVAPPANAAPSGVPTSVMMPSPSGLVASPPAIPLATAPSSGTPTTAASLQPAPSPAASSIGSPSAAPSSVASPTLSPSASATTGAAPQPSHAP